MVDRPLRHRSEGVSGSWTQTFGDWDQICKSKNLRNVGGSLNPMGVSEAAQTEFTERRSKGPRLHLEEVHYFTGWLLNQEENPSGVPEAGEGGLHEGRVCQPHGVLLGGSRRKRGAVSGLLGAILVSVCCPSSALIKTFYLVG